MNGCNDIAGSAYFGLGPGCRAPARGNLTEYKTEAAYRRYAIVSEADLIEGSKRSAALQEALQGKQEVCSMPAVFSHSSEWKSANYGGNHGGEGGI